MKKNLNKNRNFLSLYLAGIFLFFITTNISYASKMDDAICDKSSACKEYCELRASNKYDENNMDHEDLMIQCINETSNNKQVITEDLLKSITAAYEKITALLSTSQKQGGNIKLDENDDRKLKN